MSAERALAWLRSGQELMADDAERWDHGSVLRCSAHPDCWPLSAVRVEDGRGLEAAALIEFTERAMSGLPYCRIVCEDVEAGDRIRGELDARGWRTRRFVLMRHGGAATPAPAIAAEQVDYAVALGLRDAWYREDFPGRPVTGFLAGLTAFAERRRIDVFTIGADRSPIAFADLERERDGAEISGLYVAAEERGQGIGTALTLAAIAAAREVRDLWIFADDAGRPKQLYERLGFDPVVNLLLFMRFG